MHYSVKHIFQDSEEFKLIDGQTPLTDFCVKFFSLFLLCNYGDAVVHWSSLRWRGVYGVCVMCIWTLSAMIRRSLTRLMVWQAQLEFFLTLTFHRAFGLSKRMGFTHSSEVFSTCLLSLLLLQFVLTIYAYNAFYRYYQQERYLREYLQSPSTISYIYWTPANSETHWRKR